MTLFILGLPVPFQSYSVTICLVLPYNLFTGPAIPVCFQATSTTAPGPSEAETARASECTKNRVWVSQAMRLPGREHVPPPPYFVPCYNTENHFDTALIVKPSMLFAVFHFLTASAVYLGTLPLPQVRPLPSLPSPNICIWEKKEGGQLRPKAG